MTANSFWIFRLAFVGTAILSIVMLFFILRKNNRWLPQGARQWIGSVLAVIVLIVSVSVWSLLTFVLGAPFARAGQTVTPFAFKLVADDAPKNLADYKGQVVLLNYWATW